MDVAFVKAMDVFGTEFQTCLVHADNWLRVFGGIILAWCSSSKVGWFRAIKDRVVSWLSYHFGAQMDVQAGISYGRLSL